MIASAKTVGLRRDCLTLAYTGSVRGKPRPLPTFILRCWLNQSNRRSNRLLIGAALPQAEIGIIGGSGLYSMPGFTNVHEERVETPFGDPSDPFVLGELEGHKVAFLARHGRGHRILPSELNFRANIYAFKKLGVERILSVSAVGSLKEEHKPTDFVIPDQFIDRTFHRVSTFFGDGIVGHVAFGDPVCSTVAKPPSRPARAWES